MAYAILVVDEEGNTDYVCEGIADIPKRFGSMAEAKKMKEFMKIGMDEDISIVKYPAKSKRDGGAGPGSL